MRKLKLLWKAISWADHLDEEGWYKNKRYFVQLVSLLAYAGVAFGFDLGLSEAEQVAIAGGLVAIVDIVARQVGKRVDSKREKT